MVELVAYIAGGKGRDSIMRTIKKIFLYTSLIFFYLECKAKQLPKTEDIPDVELSDKQLDIHPVDTSIIGKPDKTPYKGKWVDVN